METLLLLRLSTILGPHIFTAQATLISTTTRADLAASVALREGGTGQEAALDRGPLRS